MIDATQANEQTNIEAKVPAVNSVLSMGYPVRVTLGGRTWQTANRAEVIAVLARGGYVDL